MSLRVLCVALLLGLLPYDAVEAGETRIEFEDRGLQKLGIKPAGRRTRNLTFEHTARRDVSGTPDLMAVETITVVGGVIFVEQARPQLPEFACPAVAIDPDEESGRRLSVEVGGQPATGTVYDWELEPLVGFVRSGSDALFTYMGVHGEYHRSFAGNLAGMNLFLLDTFRSLRTPERAHLAVKTPVPGYTVGPESVRIDRDSARKLTRWMRQNHLMFTDLDVDFVFRPEDGDLVIDGDPYWISLDSGRGRARSNHRPLRRSRRDAGGKPGGVRQRLPPGQIRGVVPLSQGGLPRTLASARAECREAEAGARSLYDSDAADAIRGALSRRGTDPAFRGSRPAPVMTENLGAACFAGLGPLVQRSLERLGAEDVTGFRVRNHDYVSFRLDRSKIRSLRSVRMVEDLFAEVSRVPGIARSSDIAKLSRRLDRPASLSSIALKNELFPDNKPRRGGSPTYFCFVRQNTDHRVHRKQVSREIVSRIARMFPPLADE